MRQISSEIRLSETDFRLTESDFPASLRRILRLNETESCLSETTLGWSVPLGWYLRPSYIHVYPICPYPKRPFPLAGPVVAVPTVSSHVEFKSLLACFLGSSGLRPVPVQRFLSEHLSPEKRCDWHISSLGSSLAGAARARA